jgi:hypothetical protein
MILTGRVENGVVILNDPLALPNGAEVTVIAPTAKPISPSSAQKRVKLPLVPSSQPGSLKLSNDDVAALLEQDEIST